MHRVARFISLDNEEVVRGRVIGDSQDSARGRSLQGGGGR